LPLRGDLYDLYYIVIPRSASDVGIPQRGAVLFFHNGISDKGIATAHKCASQ